MRLVGAKTDSPTTSEVASTPTDHYFAIGSRTSTHIDAMLGATFPGILVTDFYAADHHFDGRKQRCWAHILRDARDLSVQFPTDRALTHWLDRLHRISAAARDAPVGTAATRRALQRRCEARIVLLCQSSACADVPHRQLAAWLLRHLHELFTFETHPLVPTTNNQAERDLRPRVIARKIWGGTRFEQGSRDAAARFSLFATWRARGLNS